MLTLLYCYKRLLLTYKKMLDICYIHGCLLDIIIFNAKKSSLFLVGKSRSMFIDGLTIESSSSYPVLVFMVLRLSRTPG